MLHPTFGLKAAIFAMQLFVDNVVCLVMFVIIKNYYHLKSTF